MYMNGRGGLPKDEASGLQLWERAASQGDFAAKIITWLYHSRIYNGMQALPLTVRRMILLMIILPLVFAVMAPELPRHRQVVTTEFDRGQAPGSHLHWNFPTNGLIGVNKPYLRHELEVVPSES